MQVLLTVFLQAQIAEHLQQLCQSFARQFAPVGCDQLIPFIPPPPAPRFDLIQRRAHIGDDEIRLWQIVFGDGLCD
ncbi:hypothetical protein UT5_08240 [Ferrigenium sp. UT5]